MARVMVDNQNVVAPWRSSFLLISAAAVAGVIWWVLTSLMTRYVIEPLACSSSATLAACGDASIISGSVSVVIVAVGMLLFLVNQLRPRPVLTTIGSSIILWSFGQYVTGLGWLEAILWSILGYVVVYSLMGLIGNVRGPWRSIIVAAVCVFAVKLLVSF